MYRDIPVCCDATQVKEFAAKIGKAAPLLKTCDSCWMNFRIVLCEQMCSPDQSTFMEV